MKKIVKHTIQDNLFCSRYVCSDPAIILKLHEHPIERSHTTEVFSGSIKIYDNVGWEVILKTGEKIDLIDHLKHEISSLENDTIFENRTSLDKMTKIEIEEIKEAIQNLNDPNQ